MTSTPSDIVIVSNSPGELSSWVRVTANRLKEKSPDQRIILALVPCPYASGREINVAESFDTVDIVLSPAQFLQFIFLGRLPAEYTPAKQGIVVFLGGDYWHAAGLAWKLRYPAVAYTARPYVGMQKHFRHIFCPYQSVRDQLEKKGVDKDKLMVVGNLMVEGVKPTTSREEGFRRWGLDPEILTVGIFPGSRLYHMQDSLPVFLKVAEEIHREIPKVQFILGLSPFLSIQELTDCLRDPQTPIPGSGGQVSNSDRGCQITTACGVKVEVLESDQYDTMNMSDVVLTIPGTNTAEVAYLGRPMVVAASWKARIPRGGLGFFLNSIPMGGLRRAMILKLLEKQRFTSLPNMIAGEAVVPEVLVENKAEEITKVALDLIRDKDRQQALSERMRRIMGGSGAVDRITDAIIEIINSQEAQ